MIFLMTFSILAFSLDSTFNNPASFEFNGFEFDEKVFFDDRIFMQDIRKYYTVIDDEEVEFYFPPATMSQVNVSEDNLSFLSDASVVYFSRAPVSEDDFNVNLLFYDVLKLEFGENSFKTTLQGLTSHNLFEDEIGIITCDDANRNNFVFVLSNETGMSGIREVEPFCFELIGEGENFLMISDYLLYKTHGVI